LPRKYGHGHSLAADGRRADTFCVPIPQGKQLAIYGIRRSLLYGNLGGRTNEVQNTVDRADAIPHPAKLFVFVDEAEDSIDDAHFLVWPNPDPRWVNRPAGRHAQKGILSFADGHAEQWAWQWPKKFSPKQSYWKMAESPQDFCDLLRLQETTLIVSQLVLQTWI
jgi:prepilin-type processing-associated H-X9-DG protein